LLFQNYTNREDSVGRYSYRLGLRNKFRVTSWAVFKGCRRYEDCPAKSG
jgi:hypothetical protein